jgi:hypothetical protein
MTPTPERQNLGSPFFLKTLPFDSAIFKPWGIFTSDERYLNHIKSDSS